MNVNVMTSSETDKPVDNEWWRGAVIYQIYPRSFQDSNGDGIGDLTGIRTRLPYIAELGADAIWISPFFPSPMKDFGYDVSNYTDVDPMFGSIEDYRALVADAHRLGLKVMIDQVLSHTSDRHPWFAESRASRNNAKADWYVWAEPKPDGSPPNNWLSVFGGSAWQWEPTRRQYYLHNFLDSQPDLNFHNRQVQDALLDAIRFWLELGTDGFRLDTVNFYFHSQGLEDNPPLAENERDTSIAPAVNPYNYQDHLYDKSQPDNIEFLKRFRALLDEYPATTAVGEVGDAQRGQQIMAQYTSGGDKLHMCYTFEFLSGGLPRPQRFNDVVARFFETSPTGWPCWAFSNHDVIRHGSRWTADAPAAMRPKLLKMLAGVLMSIRGSVCIYEGEELGLPEAELSFEDLQDPYGIRFWPEFKGRDGCRTPMPWDRYAPNCGFSDARQCWLPVPHTHYEFAVSEQREKDGSVMDHYRRFLAFRRENPVLKHGKIEFLQIHPDILAYRRTDGSDALLCIFNFSAETVEVDLQEKGGISSLYGTGYGGTYNNGKISLPGFDAWFGRIGA
jgi:alpha-glucosidase